MQNTLPKACSHKCVSNSTYSSPYHAILSSNLIHLFSAGIKANLSGCKGVNCPPLSPKTTLKQYPGLQNGTLPGNRVTADVIR